MLYRLSYAHHGLIASSLASFRLCCRRLHVRNRRQCRDDIRMELWPSMRISGDHLVGAVPDAQANDRKRNIALD